MTRLPLLTDPIASGILVLVAALIGPTYFSRIDLIPSLVVIGFRLTLKYGISDAGESTSLL